MLSAKGLLGALVGLSILLLAEGVEVCRVSDLQLVTQSGEFFLGGRWTRRKPSQAHILAPILFVCIHAAFRRLIQFVCYVCA
jgi:hypothetical protein